jgi:photosystem II stability/assembly factor-like uncharacterized protein
VKPAFAFLLSVVTFVVAVAQAPVKVEYACPAEDLESFGLACSGEEPCAVFLELNAAEAAGDRLFLAGDLHTQSSTLYGILLASEDGGRTWTEPMPRIRAASFEQLQFLDAKNGWVSGETIEPLPRDPFLLATTDGGKTWNKRVIFEESRGGSVSQFWFDSTTAGEIVIDRPEHGATRHEVFATATGGANWDPRESTTKPVKIKGPKDALSLRVRADSVTKTYHVERQVTAGHWEVLATLSIHVTDCE